MSTTVRATCSFDCGDVKLPASEFTIVTRAEVSGGQYRFKCDKCHRICLKDCSAEIIKLLRDSSVREETYEPPLELMERPIDGELSLDGLIDLGIADEEGTLYDRITKKDYNHE